jgi:hypothetical protein
MRPLSTLTFNCSRAGILVLVNGADWELDGGGSAAVSEGDEACHTLATISLFHSPSFRPHNHYVLTRRLFAIGCVYFHASRRVKCTHQLLLQHRGNEYLHLTNHVNENCMRNLLQQPRPTNAPFNLLYLDAAERCHLD